MKTRKPAKRFWALGCGCCDGFDCRGTFNHQFEWREARNEIADGEAVERGRRGDDPHR